MALVLYHNSSGHNAAILPLSHEANNGISDHSLGVSYLIL